MAKTALDARRLNAFAVDPDNLTIIGLDTKDGSEHPLYDERIGLPVRKEQIRNVLSYGILENVLVKKDGERVLVLEGRQRVRWARETNKLIDEIMAFKGGIEAACEHFGLTAGEIKNAEERILVPCSIRRGSDEDSMGVMMAGNEIREDDSPLLKAKKAARMLNHGHSEASVAIACGVTENAVKGWIKLLDLSSKVQSAVSEGKLAATAAVKLAGLEKSEQNEKLDDLLEGSKVLGKKPTARTASAFAGKKVCPSKKIIRKAADALGTTEAAKLLGWVLGEFEDSEVVKMFPRLKDVL